MEREFCIRFGDTDPYGVVYYVTYHKWAHQAVEDYLKYKGLDPDSFFRDLDKGIGMPVVASTGRFLKPLRYPSSVKAKVEVENLGESSITFKITFFQRKNLVAELTLTFVAIDRNWNKIPLPEEYRNLWRGC